MVQQTKIEVAVILVLYDRTKPLRSFDKLIDQWLTDAYWTASALR